MWHQFVGMPRKSYLPDHIIFEARIVDPSNHYQRPGLTVWGGSASGTINHETDNYNIGADSGMHAQYLINGPVDQYGNRMDVSWHFCVDGGSTSKNHGPKVTQSIPCDEVSWQAACGACGGNYDRVSIEQCKNRDGDVLKARDAHEWLTASNHETLGLPGDQAVDLHYDWNAGTQNRHHCPDTMLDDKYIDTFRANVKRKYDQIVQFRIDAEGVPAPPQPPVPVFAPADLPDWFSLTDALEHPTDQKYRERTAYVCKRNYKNVASTATTRYSAPYIKGEAPTPASGPKVLSGDKIFGIRLWMGKDERTWILEETGHWLLASKFSPRVRIDPRTAD